MNEKEVKDSYVLSCLGVFYHHHNMESTRKKDLILSLSVRNEVNFKYTEFEMSVNTQKKLFLRQSNIKIGQ